MGFFQGDFFYFGQTFYKGTASARFPFCGVAFYSCVFLYGVPVNSWHGVFILFVAANPLREKLIHACKSYGSSFDLRAFCQDSLCKILFFLSVLLMVTACS
jgi:hypothetical protein